MFDFVVTLCVFVVIWGAIIYLSSANFLQGLKTKITGAVVLVAGAVQAALPDTVGQMVGADLMAWITLFLGITVIVSRSVSR